MEADPDHLDEEQEAHRKDERRARDPCAPRDQDPDEEQQRRMMGLWKG